MSARAKPVDALLFHGVYTDGNPATRPVGTASVCQNLRIMPGFWPRLRGGQIAQNYTTGIVQRIFPFREVDIPGAVNQLAQVKYSGSVAWSWFSLYTYAIDPFNIETIDLTHDGSFASSNPVAVTNLSDRPLFYNGLGVRDGSTSKPPFTTYFGGIQRFYGLDCYVPGSSPSVAFVAGAGNNTVATSVDIYVGLWNSGTNHYSNAVKAGRITATGATGTITASGLGNLKTVFHNATEQGELFYVFYATVDGSEVPYLILNSTFSGPLTAAISSSTQSLSVASGTTNGWNLDLTSESPIDNFPPRPMRTIAYVNGRLYGALLAGGGGTGVDFTYVPAAREFAAVVWSRAAGDVSRSDLIGDPLQSWPLENIAYTPDARAPIVVHGSQDDVRTLVITSGGTFLLEEVADGIQEYKTVSRTHGITVPTTLQVTPYGTIWVTQHNQIVMLPPNSLDLQVLSTPYQSLMTGANPRCADYLLNPPYAIDRYEVFLDNASSVVHDFQIGGEGYSSIGTGSDRDITAAQTCIDDAGNKHHIIAKAGIFTQEVQPSTGLIPTTDEVYTTAPTKAKHEITGTYLRNWDDFGDRDWRKEVQYIDVIGDGAPSAQLSGAPPLAITWFRDFEQVFSGNEKTTLQKKGNQSTTDESWLYYLSVGALFQLKLKFVITGHSTDNGGIANCSFYQSEGDLANNFYGAIVAMSIEAGVAQDRK